MFTFIGEIVIDESGATTAEYALIAGLVLIATVLTLHVLGSTLTNMFASVPSSADNTGTQSQSKIP